MSRNVLPRIGVAVTAALLVATAMGADAPTKSEEATLMQNCIAREMQRNDTSKASAEIHCKEMQEVQQDSDSHRPASDARQNTMVPSSSGHSSHSQNNGINSTDEASKAAQTPANASPAK